MFEIGIQLFSNIDRKFVFQIDIDEKSVTPEKVTLVANDSIIDDIFDEIARKDSTKLSHFTFLDPIDSDYDSDYDDNREIFVWNTTEIENRNYGEPNQTLYRKDKYIITVHIGENDGTRKLCFKRTAIFMKG